MKTKISAATKAAQKHISKVTEVAMKALNAKESTSDFTITEDILMIAYEGFELCVFPTTKKQQQKGKLATLAVQSEKAKGNYGIYQLMTKIAPGGFDGAVTLHDAKGKMLMQLPFRERFVGGGSSTPPDVSTTAKQTSAFTQKDGENTVMVVDGTNGNKHWYIAVTLNKYNVPIKIQDGEGGRTYFT